MKLAYDAMTKGEGLTAACGICGIQASYDRQETDEFVKPTLAVEDGKPVATVQDGDSIIFFTAILNISPSLYEAAKMDGANRWHMVRYIILPALLIPMTTVFILNLGYFMSAGFDQVYNFTNPAVNSVIDILDTYVNRVGIEQAQYSIGTAVSLVKGAVGVALVCMTHVASKKLTGEGVW